MALGTQWSTSWGICDPLKFGLHLSGQLACHPCHTVPVLKKREVQAGWATKPAGHHPAKMAPSARGSGGGHRNNCPSALIFKAILLRS